MNSNLFIRILVLLVMIVSATEVYSQRVSKAGTTSATFLEIGVGGKAQSMGGAFVGLSDDASALYWNAGGIARSETNQAILYYADWLADTRFNFAGVIIPAGDAGTFGLSFTSLSMPDMSVRTVDMPEGTGEYFSAGDFAIGVTYARNITTRFSIGFTAKYIQQTIWHMSSRGVAIDAGTMFTTDLLNGLVIGASISNFGTGMKMEGRDTRSFYRVDVTKLGSNERIPFNIELDTWDLPMILQIGVAVPVYKEDDLKVVAALDAMHPNDNYESLNAGLEVSYHDWVFVRSGYQSLFLSDSEGGLSLGVGVNSKMLFSENPVTFDYSYRDFGRLNSIQSFSVSVGF